jgi:hypothetical protein
MLPATEQTDSIEMLDNHPPLVPTATHRVMMTLPECAAEAGVSRRFLEKEISRGRLVARKLSSRICRVRRIDWDSYIDQTATAQRQN